MAPNTDRFEAEAQALFESRYAAEIDALADEYAETLYPDHLQLRVAYDDLADVSDGLARMALRNPETAHDALDDALTSYGDRELGQATVRIIDLPQKRPTRSGRPAKARSNA